MIAGPCVVCGATNYALSMGGPSICPTCDCGPPDPRQVRVLREANAKLVASNMQLFAVSKAARALFERIDTIDCAFNLDAEMDALEAALEALDGGI